MNDFFFFFIGIQESDGIAKKNTQKKKPADKKTYFV